MRFNTLSSAVKPLAASAGRRAFHASRAAAIAVGDSIPSATVFGETPGDKIATDELTKTGKSLLVFVPGAYSPGCSARHIPGYVSLAPKFAEKGIDSIYVISGNDAFVQTSWGKVLGDADGKIKYLADPALDFGKKLEIDFDASAFFGGYRHKRSAILVEDGVVKKLWVEPDSTGINVSEAKNVIEEI
ncbi:thioredoxin-like protein [Myxozyma melibiosi]|uniref:Thioredoxin-like protein n=1 Tax=Myxozyma melibiosi TaxID=54550 RepID=A0ABR1F5R2_9ASCO